MRRFSLRSLERYRNLGLLVARGIPGVIFLYHGWQRYDAGVSNAAGFFGGQGIPAPELMAWVVTVAEVVGGAFLIVGFLTRLVAVGFIVEMVLAILLVKTEIGLIAPMGGGAGAELDLALIAAMAAVATCGPGTLSVDRNAGMEGRR